MTAAGGFWFYDAIAGKSFGDHATQNYLRWHDIPIDVTRVYAQVCPQDQQRVVEGISRSVRESAPYKEVIGIETQVGVRKIFAAAHPLPNAYGDNHMLAGWFVEISEVRDHTRFAASVAMHYVRQAQIAARMAGAHVAEYLLEDAMLELETVHGTASKQIGRQA